MEAELKIPKYLQDTYLFELNTEIINQKEDMYEFADTIFHPQGGGQPNDKGYLSITKVSKDSPNDQPQTIKVEIVGAQSDRQTGKIFYKLSKPQNETFTLEVGDKVKMVIDQEVRRKHAKLHSAGHILDLAVQRLKYDWTTTKGYHFEDNPYVEYKGKLENVQEVVDQVNKEIQKIIEEKIVTQVNTYSWQEAVNKGIIPETFKASLIRTIHFAESSCPCGGTHVTNTQQFEDLTVTEAKKKGKNIKLFYKVK